LIQYVFAASSAKKSVDRARQTPEYSNATKTVKTLAGMVALREALGQNLEFLIVVIPSK